MTSTPVRAIFVDLPASEAYSLESVGKHGFGKRTQVQTQMVLKRISPNRRTSCSAAIEVGPQPNGVVRADVYNLMKEAVDLTFEFVQKFNAGEKQHFFLTYQYFRVGEKNPKLRQSHPSAMESEQLNSGHIQKNCANIYFVYIVLLLVLASNADKDLRLAWSSSNLVLTCSPIWTLLTDHCPAGMCPSLSLLVNDGHAPVPPPPKRFHFFFSFPYGSFFCQGTFSKGVKWKPTQWRTLWTIQGTPPPERSLRPSTPSCRHDATKTSASNGWFVVGPQISLFSSSHLLQDNDFKLLRPGDPIFKTFSGETVTYEGEELYTFFINECAYYEKKIAFLLGEKVRLNLPPIGVEKDWEGRDRKRINIKKSGENRWQSMIKVFSAWKIGQWKKSKTS